MAKGLRAFLVCLLLQALSFNFETVSRFAKAKCPTPDCVSRQTFNSYSETGQKIIEDEFVRRKRDILTDIKTASSNRLDIVDEDTLGSSFSQGYIDLGSRNPKEEGAATLAFVFDTTGSMYDDLKQVIEGAGKILRTVLEKFERPIHDYVLVPFNDPDIGKMTVTSNPEEFKRSLDELQHFIQGGGDCPEMAVGAIKMALEVCLPSSYIYVFTDARAKDFHLLDDVLRFIQKKHTQVIFVMTGDCGNHTHPGYQAFEKISSTSSGQVFHLDKSDVGEVLNFVRLSLETRKVNLLSVDREVNEAGEENIQLVVDKTLREFTISISGENPEIEIYRPNGDGLYTKEEDVNKLLTLENVKIVGVKDPIPGSYNISLRSDSKYTVRATGLSSIDFQTGFSLNPATNMKETYHRPMKGANSYVLVRPIDETEFGDLYRLQLISLNGEPLVDIDLIRVSGQESLFSGIAVTPPDQPFNIKIFGRDKSGYDFERISPTAITSQLPSPPEVVTEEHIFGYYDREAAIKCHVQTLVPFNITWKRNSSIILGPLPYPQSAEVTYIIKSPTSSDEGYYSCLATNIAGSSRADIFFDVKEAPPEVEAPSNVSLIPDRPAVVSCRVTSTVQFNVSWEIYVIKGQVEDFFGKVDTVGEFITIEDSNQNYKLLPNSSLLIKDVQQENSGWYRCKASNEGGSRSKEIFFEVLSLPEVKVQEKSVSYEAGAKVTLKCNVHGWPLPKVFWRKGDKILTNNDSRVSIDANHTLRIENTNYDDQGSYACVAINPTGKVEDYASIVFVEPARIVAVAKEVLAESGSISVLHCYTFGTPSPTVRWVKEDSSEVVEKSFIEINRGHLKIIGVQESDAGTYRCIATNEVGSSEDKIVLSVGSSPSILKNPGDQNIDIGIDGALSCYGNGIPQPTIKWTKENGDPLPSHFTQDASGTLKISGMKIKDEGTYICTLENTYGKKEIRTRLFVSGLLAPLIATPPSRRIESLAPEPVTLPCTVVMGIPPPKILWFFRGKKLRLKDGIFVTNEGDLRIPKVQGRHRGNYECVASNFAGNSSLGLYLNVLERPTIREGRLEADVKALEGQRVRLKCPVKADPKPSYSWQKNGLPVMPYQRRLRIVSDGSLIIRGIKSNDRGVYVCTAVNAAGATNTAVNLHVNVPPTIDFDLITVSVLEGEDLRLPCRVKGSPPPSIKWVKLAEPELDLIPKTMPDGSLRLRGSLYAESIYECIATNEVGTESRTVKVLVNKKPSITTVGDSELEVIAGLDLKLPCEVNGYPQPRIVWTRNEQELVISDSVRLFDDYLILVNVSSFSEGIYTCRAENRAGIDSRVINLVVKYPPQGGKAVKVIKDSIEGSSLTLPCPVSGNPNPTRTWTKDGKNISPGNRIFFESDGTLEIEGSRHHHSGIYECLLVNKYGNAKFTYDVKVLIPPKVSRLDELRKPEVIEGNEIKIKCPVDAFPIPTIDWTKDGINIFSTKDRADVTHIIVEENGQTLHIFEATMDDQGTYRCIVKNSAGETSVDFPLKVLVPPHFTTFLHNPQVEAIEGEEIIFDCSASGVPDPKLVWERNRFKLPTFYPQVSPNGRLIRITRVTQTDAGLYTCTAANSVGIAARNFSLTVYSPPMIDFLPGRLKKDIITVMGQDAKVECRTSGSPFPSVTWTLGDIPIEIVPGLRFDLFEDDQILILHSLSPEHSGTYICNATNIIGSSIKAFNISVFTPPYVGNGEEFITEIERVVTTLDATLTLSCEGGGLPPPTYSWFWKNRPLSPSMMSYQTEGPKLLINKISVDSTGTFFCLLVNPAGSSEKHFEVVVNVPATIGNEFNSDRTNRKAPQRTFEVTAHTPLSLYCPAFGIPEPTVSWIKDGQQIEVHWKKISITNTTTTNISSQDGVSSKDVERLISKKVWTGRIHLSDRGQRLDIDPVSPQDSGIYTCTAHNQAGSDSMDSSVSVIDPPKVTKRSKSPIMIQEDFPLQLICAFKGIPPPFATWLFNGVDLKHLPVEGVVTHNSIENEISLIVEQITKEHVGSYTCLVSSIAGTDEAIFDVTVATFPKINKDVSGNELFIISLANRPVTFECQVDSFPPPVYQWFFNGSPIDPSDDRYYLSSGNRNLQILIANPKDTGQYSCLAVNSVGFATQNFTLNINVPPHLENRINEEIIAEEGEFTDLICSIEANPPPTIIWMKDSTIINRHFSDSRHLIIEKASREDEGRYTCIATNTAGTMEQSFTVHVLVPPKLENINKAILEKSVVVNRQVSISCFILSHSDVQIVWRKGGELLTYDTKTGISMSQSGKRLDIAQARPDHAGAYTCSATNAAGQINSTTTLSVLSPPTWSKNASNVIEIIGIKNKKLIIDCEVEGFPSPSLLWLKGGQLIKNESTSIQFTNKQRSLTIYQVKENDAGRYSCIASNAAGTLEKNILVSIHHPPSLSHLPSKAIKVLKNRPAHLTCPVKGNPLPDITWSMDGKKLVANSNLIQFSNSNRDLHILRASGSGNVTVTCFANNSIGELATKFILNVLNSPVIHPSPTNPTVIVLEGETVQLKCNASGYPTPQVFWVKEDGTLILPENETFRQVEISNKGQTLTLLNVHTNEEGDYICSAVNEGGFNDFTFTVLVNSPPEIQVPIDGTDVIVALGSYMVLRCDVVAKPIPFIKWYKNDERLHPTDDPFMYMTNYDKRLRFTRVLPNHAGNYSCVAKNEVGHDELQFSVQVLYPPSIEQIQNSSLEVFEGEILKLECNVQGEPAPLIQWKKGDIILSSSRQLEFLNNLNSYMLILKNATLSDAGDYICEATSSVGAARALYHVEVYSRPRISSDTLINQEVILGHSHTLHCHVKGTPEPIISWTRRGSSIDRFTDPNVQVSNDRKQLTIVRARVNDGGFYTCVASSISGQDSKTFSLSVLVPPTIQSANQPSNVMAITGKWIELVCEASGNPEPRRVWMKYERDIAANNRIQISDGGGHLLISKLQSSDSGLYTCRAENVAGEDTRNITLQVMVAPELTGDQHKKIRVKEGTSFVISCQAEAFPEPSYSWTKNAEPIIADGIGNFDLRDLGRTLKIVRIESQDAASYQCTASNAAGKAQQTVDVEVVVPPLIAGGKESGSSDELIKVIEGGHVTFECHLLQGHPLPNRRWFSGSDSLPVNHTISGEGKTMVILKASLVDAGPYRCNAENEFGSSEKFFRLVVQTPPKINIVTALELGLVFKKLPVPLPPDGTPRQSSIKSSITTIKGKTFIIPCPVEGIPDPRILWYRGSSAINQSPRFMQNRKDSGLTISNAMPSDSGRFTCVGVNPAGEIELSISLLVEERPLIMGDAEIVLPAVVGQSLSMDCQILPLRPTPQQFAQAQSINITWAKDGEAIYDSLLRPPLHLHYKKLANEFTDAELLKYSRKMEDKSISYILSRDSSKLTIPRIKAGVQGRYKCKASNTAGFSTKTFHIDILTAPTIDTLEEIRVFEAAVGEPVVFECNASGQPPPEVNWYKEDLPVKSSSRHQFLESSHVLIIQSVQEEDEGQYTCYASNAAGMTTETFSLTILVPPRLMGNVEERIEVVSGRPVKLNCPMEGFPIPEISWSFENKVIYPEDGIISLDGNTLTIERASPDLAGKYVCDGINAVGRTFKITHLIVKEAPVIFGNTYAEIETAVEGDAATLHCIASGQPFPSLQWKKDGLEVRLNHRVSVSWGGRTLIVQNVKMEDGGRYTCTASNSAGNDTRQYKLNVLQPPKIEEGPGNIVAVEGEVITVFCSISGNPSPKLTWYYNGVEITNMLKELDYHSVKANIQDLPEELQRDMTKEKNFRGLLESGALQFSPVLPEYSGNYSCAADNEAGRATHTFSVSVLFPPQAFLEISPALTTTGQEVDFFCKVKGSPPIVISWIKGSAHLRPGSEIQFGANGTLKIPSVTLEMAGVYTCLAKNSAGFDEDSESLIVQELPKVSAVTKEIIVPAGQEAKLSCRIHGDPVPSVTWSRPDLGGKVITPDNIRVQVWENELIISPVTNEDSGTYRCTGTNRAGSDHANLALVVTSTPKVFEALDETLTVVLGESISLSCTVLSGFPPPSVIWRKDGRRIKTNKRTNLDTNGEIFIDNVKEEDSGMYSCLVVNAAGRMYRVVTVVVKVPPRLTILPKTQEVTKGDSFYLECEAVGVPVPTISWLLNGTKVEGASSSFGGRVRLDIQRAAKSDEGTYTCLAKNVAGHRKAVAAIRVRVPPIIMFSPGEMTVQEQSSVMLTCLAEGDPYPAITWTKEGHYIAASDRVHIMKNGSLIIDVSKGSDAGKYTCVVSNDAGATEAVSHLKVTMAPKIIEPPLSVDVEIGDTVMFNCEADGEPAPETQWSLANKDMNSRFKILTNGSLQLIAAQVEDEGHVICQVFNEFGEDLAKASISVRVPGMWGEWGPWDECSATCGSGFQIRRRRCDSPAPRNGGKHCQGEDEAERPCRLIACPIDGGWSLWDNWSKCSVSCGGGTRLRSRVCNNPTPLHGGESCRGSELKEELCKIQDCPVNGNWSEWSPWTDCSRTCGEALRQRTRICNNPVPSNGGKYCDDNDLEVIPCDNEACAIHGNWGSWDEWSICSQPCGYSIRYKKRRCNNPIPENGGTDCQGDSHKENSCDVPSCVIHGQWSSWSDWSSCSATCAKGHRERKRLCNNPQPKDGGEKCSGPDRETQQCESQPCPVHGNWGLWSDWSSCSMTCGAGVRQRSRRCNNPYPRNGGKMCKGSETETSICEDFSCKELPIRAYGTLRGFLNGEDLGVISLAGNVTTNGNQRTLVIALSPILAQYATWLTPLISVVSSAIWASAFEVGDAKNGNSLTKSKFTRESHVTFNNGARVDISQTARGIDETGTLRFNVEVNGDVPYLQPGSFVSVQPFSEEYIQIGKGSLYVQSSRTFAVSGYHYPYTWNETIDYDPSSGLMPTMIQTLHANSVSASYRCMTGIEGSNSKGELSIMVSSVITASSKENCPSGFTFTDDKEAKLCKDNNECESDVIGCSHSCRNIIGGYRCECPNGYQIKDDGKTCEDIDECSTLSTTCSPHEICVNSLGSFICKYFCGPGFHRTSSGTACEDIDECQENEPCDQECQNLVGSYRCKCYRGFSQDKDGRCSDVNECEIYRNLCSHKCTNTPGSFKCSCPNGYRLLNNGRCKDIDECTTFEHNCSLGEACQNEEGGFKCITECPTGLTMTGNGSCIDIDECSHQSVACHYTQRCENIWGTYRCSCQRGYRTIGPGHPCIDINECNSSPPPCIYQCRNLMGDYECICPPGMRRLRNKKTCIASQYDEQHNTLISHRNRPPLRQRYPAPNYRTREYDNRLLRRVYRVIECPEGFVSKDNGGCEDLNECSKPGRCQHACENTHGSFYCTCPSGYSLMDNLEKCQDIDECGNAEASCHDGDLCINIKGSFRCSVFNCPNGYIEGPQQGFCEMDCRYQISKCPSGVQRNHYIIHNWTSVSAGTLDLENLIKISPVDRKGNLLPHSEFSVTGQESESAFEVSEENGIGVLSSTKTLTPGKEYSVIVEANSFDSEQRFIKYSTQFIIVLYVSEYPY